MAKVSVKTALAMRMDDKDFVVACGRANEVLANRPGYRKVEPTRRQFAKFRRGFGSAYDFGRG